MVSGSSGTLDREAVSIPEDGQLEDLDAFRVESDAKLGRQTGPDTGAGLDAREGPKPETQEDTLDLAYAGVNSPDMTAAVMAELAQRRRIAQGSAGLFQRAAALWVDIGVMAVLYLGLFNGTKWLVRYLDLDVASLTSVMVSLPGIFALLCVVYKIAAESTYGMTFGKKMTKLWVSTSGSEAPSILLVCARNLPYVVVALSIFTHSLLLVFRETVPAATIGTASMIAIWTSVAILGLWGIGHVVMVFTQNRRGLFDLLSGTRVTTAMECPWR